MSEIRIARAMAEDIAPLAAVAREQDVAEAWALAHQGIDELLQQSLERSTVAWSAWADDEPAAIWGVNPTSLIGDTGTVWMATGQPVMDHQMAFLRRAGRYLMSMHDTYRRLRNEVWAQNTIAIKWLGWLGFEFEAPIRHGPDREWFYPFVRSV